MPLPRQWRSRPAVRVPSQARGGMSPTLKSTEARDHLSHRLDRADLRLPSQLGADSGGIEQRQAEKEIEERWFSGHGVQVPQG